MFTPLLVTSLITFAVPQVQIAQAPTINAEAIALHLKKINAKMYGAYWCPACTRQKEIFGDRAFRLVQYIECDSRGQNAQPQICRSAQIRAYPTWEIKGNQYQGVQSLADLARLSGFEQGK